MSLPKPLRLAIKALSKPNIDLEKTYRIVRRVTRAAHHPRLTPLYKPWDHIIWRDGHKVPVRVFTPDNDRRTGKLLLFFHGGGWVTGDIDCYSDICVRMSNMTGHKVVSVDYSLAPEHRFPAGLEDCYCAMQEILQNAAVFGTVPGRVALIGDSAGGNLAAACSLLARDRGGLRVGQQILLYPSTYNDHDPRTSPFDSVRENGQDNLLTVRLVKDYIALYESSGADRCNPYFAPLIAGDLSCQPDTLIITAELDPLRDEGEAYGRRLAAAGAYVQVHRMPDALHGFLSLPGLPPPVKRAYGWINAFLYRTEYAARAVSSGGA